jgi:hypothetical protein
LRIRWSLFKKRKKDIVSFGVTLFLCYRFLGFLGLTLLVILVTSLANTAREVGDKTLGAADALHIQGAAVAEAGSDTGCGARGKAWDLGGGEGREQSYGCEGEGGVHVERCRYYRV